MHHPDDDKTTDRRIVSDEPTNGFSEDEPTHLISFDDDEPAHPAGDEPEDQTHLISFDDDDLVTDQTVDRAREMPRYITNRAAADDKPFIPGIQHGLVADFDFCNSTEDIENDDESLELKLDKRDYQKRSPEGRQESASRRFVRNFTVIVSTQAKEVLRSPARAFFIAGSTAAVTLFIGISLVYSALAHAHLDNQIKTVEAAVDADLYSSHRAALHDLQGLIDHQVLPAAPIDSAIKNIVDRLPLLGTESKKDRLHHLHTFLKARQDYRFATPGAYLDELPDAEASELLMAAEVYRLLSIGDSRRATRLATEAFDRGGHHRFTTLSHGDALLIGGTSEQVNLIADYFPRSTTAEAFVAAQLQLRLDARDTAAEEFQYILDVVEPNHIGAALKLAAIADNANMEESSLETIIDREKSQASPVEIAGAHVLLAQKSDRDESTRRAHLEEAADIAPLSFDAVSPLIEFLLARGELLEARSQLSRTPSASTRHRYFDTELSRVHLAIGDIERAKTHLNPHIFDDLTATAMLGVASAHLNEFNKALALFDAVAEDDEDLATLCHIWLDAAAGTAGDPSTVIDIVSRRELPLFFVALAAETLRRNADLVPNRGTSQELRDHAKKILIDHGQESPEIRRQACLIALDQRSPSSAQSTCSTVAELDITSRWSLFATLRWKLYEGDIELINAHRAQTGPHPHIELHRARLALIAGDTDGARELLDNLSSRVMHSSAHFIVEGMYALQTDRPQRAAQQFDRAEQGSSFYLPEAILGRIDAILSDVDEESKIDADEIYEEAIRKLLQHGEFGPRAWSLFASLRRLQGRMADADENLDFASRNFNDYGLIDERIYLSREELAIALARHGTDDARVATLRERLEDLQ